MADHSFRASVVATVLASRGVTQRAIDNATYPFGFGEQLRRLGWSWERFWYFCAFDITDVFGGMGSWNDLPLSDDDADEYVALTDTFSTARDRVWKVII